MTIKKALGLTRIDKFIAIGLAIEGVTGTIGSSMILTEQKPIFTLIVLAIGMAASKVNNFIATRAKEIRNSEKENGES